MFYDKFSNDDADDKTVKTVVIHEVSLVA